mgnify:CR=1 FL=1
MGKLTAKAITDWLKKKLGDNYSPDGNPLWFEHDYAFGNTESGFSSAYTINYDAVEREMDKWIAETFGKDDSPSNAIGQRGAASGASDAPTGCASNGDTEEE